MKSNRNPLISIGIPVYNGQHFLKKTVDSLTKQTYKNIEIIISDNSSTDKTYEIAKKLVAKDSRIRLYKQSKNIGELPNYNFVLSKAKGELFSWHAADDFRDPKNLETLYQLLVDNPSAVGAMCRYKNEFKGKTYFVNDRFAFDNNWSTVDSLKHFIKTGNIICLFGLYKTKTLKNAGGHHRDSRPFHKGSDFLTVFRPLLKGKMVYTDKVLFIKLDTGLFTKRYEVIQTDFFSTDTFTKVLRYLLSPVYFLYNLFYSVIYLWSVDDEKSFWRADKRDQNLTIINKIDLTVYLFYYWIVHNILFLLIVLKGLFLVLRGLFKKI